MTFLYIHTHNNKTLCVRMFVCVNKTILRKKMVADSTTWYLQQKPPFVGDKSNRTISSHSPKQQRSPPKPEKILLDLLLVAFEEKVVKSCQVLSTLCGSAHARTSSFSRPYFCFLHVETNKHNLIISRNMANTVLVLLTLEFITTCVSRGKLP